MSHTETNKKQKIIESALGKMKESPTGTEASKWYIAGFLDGVEFTISNLYKKEKTTDEKPS